MNRFFKFISELNLKTIYFNFKYLEFKQAIRFPVLVSRRVYLEKVSGKIIFECPIRTGLVEIGFGNVGIFDKKVSRSIWEVRGTVIFRGKAFIGHGSKISVGDCATLILGDCFKISAESSIVTVSKIQFGDNCLLSWDILIMDTDFHKIRNEQGAIINKPEPIIFGDKIWVGCRCLILKGSKIPNNCIIGASSFVSKALDKENALYSGNPAVCIRENVTWE
jgi:hypothetical protein